jgi:hypothetical protein
MEQAHFRWLNRVDRLRLVLIFGNSAFVFRFGERLEKFDSRNRLVFRYIA